MSPKKGVTAGSVATGGVVGLASYVLGYLVVYLTQRGAVEERLQVLNMGIDFFGGEPIPAWQAVGWLFYNAHFVDTEIPGFGGTRTANFVSSSDDGSLTLLFVLPPMLLAFGGVTLALLSRADSPDLGALTGALSVVGYLPLAVAGAIVFGYSAGDGAVAPDLITATLLAGVVYPVACGAVGGTIAGALTGQA